MNKLLTALALATLAAAAGCGDDETTAPPTQTKITPTNTSQIVPMAIGNTWYGFFQQFNEQGVVVLNGPDTTGILRDTMVGGEKWYICNDPKLTLWAHRSDGFYIWPIWVTGAGAGLALKFPAQVGDTFDLHRVPFENDDGMVVDTLLEYYKVVSVDTTITVRAGTFRCYEYQQVRASALGVMPASKIRKPDRYFMTPGIGYIRRDLYGYPVSTGHDLKIHWELTGAILNK